MAEGKLETLWGVFRDSRIEVNKVFTGIDPDILVSRPWQRVS